MTTVRETVCRSVKAQSGGGTFPTGSSIQHAEETLGQLEDVSPPTPSSSGTGGAKGCGDGRGCPAYVRHPLHRFAAAVEGSVESFPACIT